MLRLLGILTLGNMIFGGHRCHCHHHRYGGLGRGLLLGALIGLFASRANQNRTEEYEGELQWIRNCTTRG